MREHKFKINAGTEQQPDIRILSLCEIRDLYIEFDSSWCAKILSKARQYTGLKDKNGKEIFEGDILTNKYGSEWGDVRYGQYASRRQHKHDCVTKHVGWFVCRKDGVCDSLEDEAWYIDDSYSPKRTNNIEIIGNIYENPELLKGA